MKAIGYVRVSTEEQVLEGVSLANQEAKIRAYAELNDLDLVEVISDAGKSAKTTDREGLKQLMAMVESCGIDAVIVYKLDRLSRRVVDTLTLIETIEKAGIAFHSIQEKVDTKSALGRFFLTITAAYGQMERDTISERTIAALAHKQSIGEHVGGVPFGYQVEGTALIEISSEIEAIRIAKELRSKGLTLQSIANELNAKGMKTRRGKDWQPTQIKRITERKEAA